MSEFDELLDALDAAGLWAGLPGDERESAIDDSKESDEASWSGGGLWRADGEDLADGSVQEWVQSLASTVGCRC